MHLLQRSDDKHKKCCLCDLMSSGAANLREHITAHTVLMWCFSTVASHMLVQVTVLMESFVTQGTFLRLLQKVGVFAPSVGSLYVFSPLD